MPPADTKCPKPLGSENESQAVSGSDPNSPSDLDIDSAYSRHLFFSFFGGRILPKENLKFSLKRLPNLCALNLFFGRDNEGVLYGGGVLSGHQRADHRLFCVRLQGQQRVMHRSRSVAGWRHGGRHRETRHG